ncbi:hypothetical protein B0T16DRAFT_455470 [Cercophora newfieldiana]|uniref:Xylanolytic transcriptional activator regulatory domain-containing protein n=1 Tax=Cercophora newfieldiana TaxID=92897 RepID=A0AA39YIC1_9PEZI|nr:hypothetical protein B0T16DRAFT_455470 [Cercophora newfieldiana]
MPMPVLGKEPSANPDHSPSLPSPPLALPPIQVTQTATPPFFPAGVMSPFKKISERFAALRREDSTKPLERLALSPFTASASEILLVQQTVDDICVEIPFLNIPQFLDILSRPDAIGIPDAWWQGLMNALIASALVYKTHTRSIRDVAPYSWAFFRNAYAVLPELIIQGDTIGATQAVMAMALFTRQSADIRTTARLLGMAVRMHHTAGLNVTTLAGQPILSDEDENQRRLALTAFVLDMEIVVNTGLAPAHADRVANGLLPLPTMPATSSAWYDSVFQARVALAQIQVRLAASLASPNQADLIALESELEAWSLRVPSEIRPNSHYRDEASAPQTALDLPVAILHLVYYNCLCMVAWALVRHVTDQMLKSGLPEATDCFALSERTGHHRNVARVTARATIRTMSRFPVRLYADLWRVVAYPLAASIALLAVVCKEPDHPDAQTDLSLLSWFAHFLDRMVREEGCDLEKMRDGVSKFEMVASDAVAAALGSVMPVNPSLWPLTLASGQTGKAMATLMTCSSYVPMYLAQALIGNLSNRDTKNAKKLAEILEIPWADNGYGPFVPDSLIPVSYGFAFQSGGSSIGREN